MPSAAERIVCRHQPRLRTQGGRAPRGSLRFFIAALRLNSEDLAPDAKLFTRFRTLIECWYVEHRPVSDYPDALGITQKRLNQLCRQIADATPTELIHARLAIEAERGLRYGRMTIAALGCSWASATRPISPTSSAAASASRRGSFWSRSGGMRRLRATRIITCTTR